MTTTPEAQAAFDEIADSYKDDPAVTTARMFSAAGLRVGDKFFAFTTRGLLAMKLPKPKVDDLIAAGIGEPFGPGTRVMKEWVAIKYEHVGLWPALAREARAFVASVPDQPKRRKK